MNTERTMPEVVSKNIDWSKVESALRDASVSPDKTVAVASNRRAVFPGAVLHVVQGGEVLFHQAFGSRSVEPDHTTLNADMVFDVASLTKVIITTTLAMQLAGENILNIDSRLSRIFQTFGTHGKETMTVKHLLTHMSGYAGTHPYYKYIAKADSTNRAGVMTSRTATEMIYNEIFRSKLENMPGKVTRYSDIGFILLGHAIELLTGQNLDKLALKQVIRPLGLRSTSYIDLSSIRRRGLEPVTDVIVPTARCPWRGRILCGEVHDDNAWAMGGIASHAGIFSTASDVGAFATEMIDCWHGRGSLVDQEIIRKFWTRAGVDPESSWALGWDTPSSEGSSAGKYFSKSAVGHLGFTGCSLWIEPEAELAVVLLSNRIHPSTENNAIREFRPLIHDLVMEALRDSKRIGVF